MVEGKLLSFDPKAHIDEFVKIYIEWGTWFSEGHIEHNQFDPFSIMETNVTEWVNNNLEPYISLRLPKGTLQVIEVDGELAGVGVMHKLSESTGEIKRMFVRPKFRGNGFGRLLLNKLLDLGRGVGCSRFLLDSPNYAFAAHNLYRSSGFVEVEEYPESEIPVDWRQYWIFMEKLE